MFRREDPLKIHRRSIKDHSGLHMMLLPRKISSELVCKSEVFVKYTKEDRLKVYTSETRYIYMLKKTSSQDLSRLFPSCCTQNGALYHLVLSSCNPTCSSVILSSTARFAVSFRIIDTLASQVSSTTKEILCLMAAWRETIAVDFYNHRK